jgi:hypothetical protein
MTTTVRVVMLPPLSRRRSIATLVASLWLVLRGNAARADHEYVGVVTNTQLDPAGEPGLVGKTLVVEERPASPKALEGCHGVVMPAFHVRVEHERGEPQRLLMGIDATFHPDPPAPAPVRPGDRLVVAERGGGDCGDGTSLLYLHPVSRSS